MVYFFSIALGFDSISRQRIRSLMLVLLGVSAAAVEEMFVDPRGLILQLTGLTCETLKSTWLKRNWIAAKASPDLVETLSYVSPVIFLSTLPVALLLESDSMMRFVLMDTRIMIHLSANILLAVVLNLAYLNSVKTCSVTTCAVATVAKDCFLVYVSPFIFGSTAQYSSALYGIAVLGILQYMQIVR